MQQPAPPPITTITASGRAVPLLEMRPEHVRWPDVAYSLAAIPRFGGHCIGFYSVAQHCMLVAGISFVAMLHADTHPALSRVIAAAGGDAPKALKYLDKSALSPLARHLSQRGLWTAALIHDAHEAYIGDITTPTAAALTSLSGGADPVGALKDRIDAAIYAAAGIAWPLPLPVCDLIAAFDRIALIAEARRLLLPSPDTRRMIDAAAGDIDVEPFLPGPLHIRAKGRMEAETEWLSALLSSDWPLPRETTMAGAAE